MILTDTVYGRHVADQPVLRDLIQTPEFQRLKRISQFGIPDDLYHAKNFYRYEHSLGTLILLKRLGADREEQIAGLLHDVSHTAFSHVADWLFGEGAGSDETYQDKQHHAFLSSSRIPEILKRHGYAPDRIARHDIFPLLEQPSPRLCADRVDYALREIPRSTARALLPHFTAWENRIIMASRESALLFATEYLRLQENHWASFEAVSRYKLFSGALRHALKIGILHPNDFWKDDSDVMKKLKSCDDRQIQEILGMLRHKSLDHFERDRDVTNKKFRYVDPEFVKHDTMVRLSETDEEFVQLLEAAQKRNAAGWHTAKIVLS